MNSVGGAFGGYNSALWALQRNIGRWPRRFSSRNAGGAALVTIHSQVPLPLGEGRALGIVAQDSREKCGLAEWPFATFCAKPRLGQESLRRIFPLFHKQAQKATLAHFEEVLAGLGDIGFGIRDPLLVHVNGAGFDKALGFGV